MYLYELGDDPKLTKLIAATDQLKLDLDQGKIQRNWSLDELLKYFRKFDLILSPQDMYGMVQQKPLKNVISNVQGNEVVFKGLEPSQPATETPPPEQSKEVVKKMAQSAMK